LVEYKLFQTQVDAVTEYDLAGLGFRKGRWWIWNQCPWKWCSNVNELKRMMFQLERATCIKICGKGRICAWEGVMWVFS